MKVASVIEAVMLQSRGQAKVVKVPERMIPTAESLRKLEDEIAFQIEANERMRIKSMQQH